MRLQLVHLPATPVEEFPFALIIDEAPTGAPVNAEVVRQIRKFSEDIGAKGFIFVNQRIEVV